MKKQSLGATVVALRKEKGMTQLELAEQMGVTDKAVSPSGNGTCPCQTRPLCPAWRKSWGSRWTS